MSVFQTDDMGALFDFQSSFDQLAVVSRVTPKSADVFFQKLMRTSFSVVGQVFKDGSADDIAYILEDHVPAELRADPFYTFWISDMADICRAFCDVLGSEAIGFCLGTERGCRRYHVDNVPLRLLVTYAGQGTEWLPDEAADRRALARGAPNEEIVKDMSARQFMEPWDVAVFRGGPKGLLHRTPDEGISAPSILMRLDHEMFWDSILKQQQGNFSLKVANG